MIVNRLFYLSKVDPIRQQPRPKSGTTDLCVTFMIVNRLFYLSKVDPIRRQTTSKIRKNRLVCHFYDRKSVVLFKQSGPHQTTNHVKNQKKQARVSLL